MVYMQLDDENLDVILDIPDLSHFHMNSEVECKGLKRSKFILRIKIVLWTSTNIDGTITALWHLLHVILLRLVSNTQIDNQESLFIILLSFKYHYN